MRFSRKLQKLLSPELFASAFEHLSRLTHPVNRRRILDTLDRAQFEKLRDQYPYRPGSPRINRFEDVVYWIEINIERAQDLFSGIIGGRTGRDPADFELRVLGMVLISAVYEASREWVRRGGQGSLVELINQALDMIEMGARLDAL